MFRVVFVGLLKSATRTLTKNLNQKTTTLEAARKLALHVALWTWPIGGIESKPEPREKISEAELLRRDLADAQYATEDEERLRTEPLDSSGNYALRPRGELSEEPAKEAAKQESPGLLEAAPNG
jgi:hypothetical protein